FASGSGSLPLSCLHMPYAWILASSQATLYSTMSSTMSLTMSPWPPTKRAHL
ncbi:hypothetical protein GGI02_005189, partial [Coemansia sp. RSA 2322]